MATAKDFIDFASGQIAEAGAVSFKKMFGEYMIYCDGKPVFLVCDNTVYVKMLPEVSALFSDFGITPETGTPYKGAKPHYILDIENGGFSAEMARLLARILPMPKSKSKKK